MHLNSKPQMVVYRNYRGEVAVRNLRLVARGSGPPNPELENSQLYENEDPKYHAVGEMVFEALDMDRNVFRTWAAKDVLVWGQEAVQRWAIEHAHEYDRESGSYRLAPRFSITTFN